MKDYRQGQKIIATIVLEDKGQDFTELDVLENGVILGNSIMFRNGCLTLIGIGALNGNPYWVFGELKSKFLKRRLKGLTIYTKETGTRDPIPWEATTLNYKILNVKKPVKINRFIKGR